ncbi:S8 family peptidase [Bacillus sp. SCS-151]|uniref:S8 family peptidase n=1 Tax=Nanhaiella sioensis TaxID=3115293 RepID=UPI0039795CD9
MLKRFLILSLFLPVIISSCIYFFLTTNNDSKSQPSLINAQYVVSVFQELFESESSFGKEKPNSDSVIPWGIEKVISPFIPSDNFGSGVKIAILDSGIDKNHEDLKSSVAGEFNAISPNTPVIDDLGHGTNVAGIISAQNNDVGIIGIAPGAELYSIKVLDEFGYGELSHIQEAIEWCIDNKIQIINMSFGIEEDKVELRNAINKAINANIVVVAAAGNSSNGSVEYPAAYDEVISVTAVDKENNIASFSPNGKIDFAAPGVDILTTTTNNSYRSYNGTSLATAHISGIVSLILQYSQQLGIEKNDTFLHEKVYEILLDMSEDSS